MSDGDDWQSPPIREDFKVDELAERNPDAWRNIYLGLRHAEAEQDADAATHFETAADDLREDDDE